MQTRCFVSQLVSEMNDQSVAEVDLRVSDNYDKTKDREILHQLLDKEIAH